MVGITVTTRPRRRVVLVRPHRVAPTTAASHKVRWLRRRTTFGRLAIAMALLAAVMFATRSPVIGALAALASVLSLAVVLKARRHITSTKG